MPKCQSWSIATSSISWIRSRSHGFAFLIAVCCAVWGLAPPVSAGWREVEISPVRFTPPEGADVLDLAGLTPAPLAHDLQPNNINRRLVPYGPDLPLAERRARDLAEESAHWFAFADQHLRDGDVLFRLGRARTHLIMNFSVVTARATRSRYSHSGVFRWRDGVPEVVDITSTGYRAQAFPVWMREVERNKFAIGRLKPAYRSRIPQVLAFLQRQSEVRPEFDYVFEPDNGVYYCNEMTELAFRAAGVALSEPVPSNLLPGRYDVPVWIWLIEHVGKVNMETPVYVVGNADYGMYGSDKLDVVYVSEDDRPERTDGVIVAVLPSPD